MARAKKIKPVNLDKAIAEILNQYGDDVYEVLDDCVKEVSDEATQKLRAVSTFATGGHTKYSSDWVNDETLKTTKKTERVVHNSKYYRLTHLLEKGHVVKNGRTRITGETWSAGAYPHIAPVNDWATKELPRMVERKIQQI